MIMIIIIMIKSSNYSYANYNERWRSWLRHWAKCWKVAGYIPDRLFVRFFIDLILPAEL
jgi:hypothetical protein